MEGDFAARLVFLCFFILVISISFSIYLCPSRSLPNFLFKLYFVAIIVIILTNQHLCAKDNVSAILCICCGVLFSPGVNGP